MTKEIVEVEWVKRGQERDYGPNVREAVLRFYYLTDEGKRLPLMRTEAQAMLIAKGAVSTWHDGPNDGSMAHHFAPKLKKFTVANGARRISQKIADLPYEAADAWHVRVEEAWCD